MIQLSRNYSLPEREEESIPIKVVGVGGAGSNVLDRIVLDGLEKADLIAVNTDVQSLASSVAAHKVQLGRSVTRGLGTGGDPELGFNAAHESAEELRPALADARMIFVCAGLGGGTGSGAAPVVAQFARESGALVIGFATLPFGFEGKRRAVQAQEALARLSENTDAIVCFENDRLGEMVAPKAGIHQAFAAADVTISQSVRSIVNLIQRPGLIRIGFDDLLVALRSPNGRCLFGFGESDSDNRAHEALTMALKSPLMDRGRMLEDAAHVLVQIAGGAAMTFAEVEIVMKELNRHINDQTQILFGTSVDNRMGNRLSVTLISSLSTDEPAPAQSAPVFEAPVEQPKPPPIWEQQPEPEPEQVAMVEPEPPPVIIESPAPPAQFLGFDEQPAPAQDEPEEVEAIEPEPVPLPVVVKKKLLPKPILPSIQASPPKEPLPLKEPKKVQARQEVLQFEPITRGRFEKSEPTIIEGQDLDVPTFLRKNVRVK